MKRKERKAKRERQKRHTKFLSNLSVKNKVTIIFSLAVFSCLLLFVLLCFSAYRTERAAMEKVEKTAVSSAEQYINACVENVTAISQNLYSNSSLYAFLNTTYASSADYYDAYYQLRDNNSISVVENRSIRHYFIYTENSTVMRGGDIYPLDSVKGEEWYQYFLSAKKNMIVYFDSIDRVLSLIQKLDYVKFGISGMGESYLKIDIDTTMLESYFDSLDFDGDFYVLTGGTVLYSNHGENDGEIHITPNYYTEFKNYYTAQFEFCALSTHHSFFGVMAAALPEIAIFLVFFLLVVIVVTTITHNIISRSTRFAAALKTGTLSSVRDLSGAKDEIGIMIDSCITANDKMELAARQSKRLESTLRKTMDDTAMILLSSLDLDAAIHYDERFSSRKNVPNRLPERALHTPIPLSEELHNTADIFTDEVTIEKPGENFPTGLYTLPLGILMMTDTLLELLPMEARRQITIRLEEAEGEIHVVFAAKGKLPSGKILKLEALFEDHPERTDFDFRAGYLYNSCIRVKRFYGSDVSIQVRNDKDLELRLRFKRSAMDKDYRKES